MANKCYNCRYVKHQMYGKDLCKAPGVQQFTIEDGEISKIYQRCDKVREEKVDCKYFKPTAWRKFKLMLSTIRIWYYKKRYPEYFV